MTLRGIPQAVPVSVTPRTNLLNYRSYTNSSLRVGGIVSLQLTVSLSTPTTWSSEELYIATLEESARPSRDVELGRQLAVTCGIVGSTKILNRALRVTTDGRVWFIRNGNSTPDVSTVCVHGVLFAL